MHRQLCVSLGPGLRWCLSSLLFLLSHPPHPPLPALQNGEPLLAAALSESLWIPLCVFCIYSPKREHRFGWTDTGLWAMLSSQAR